MKTREKRKSVRLKIPLQIGYRLTQRRKALLEKVLAKNISGGGLALRLNYPLKKGSRLNTLLYFPNDKKPVVSISEVVWCKKLPKGGTFDVGIRHIKVFPKDRERFVFLFCETMINFFLFPRSFISVKL